VLCGLIEVIEQYLVLHIAQHVPESAAYLLLLFTEFSTQVGDQLINRFDEASMSLVELQVGLVLQAHAAEEWVITTLELHTRIYHLFFWVDAALEYLIIPNTQIHLI
jgi:hypothetical protein